MVSKKLVSKKQAVGMGLLGLFLVILGIVLTIGVAVLVVFMFIWNITDIQNVGPNFWNVTWLVLASIMGLGIVASIFKR